MTFTPNKPVETNEPKIVVDAGLPVGRHRFQLIVINQHGVRSPPTEATVTIAERGTIGGTVPIPVVGPTPITGPVRRRRSSGTRAPRRRTSPSP